MKSTYVEGIAALGTANTIYVVCALPNVAVPLFWIIRKLYLTELA